MGIQVDSGARELVLLSPQIGLGVTTGNGSVPGNAVNVGAYSQLEIFLEINGLSGTPTLNVYLDISSDGGTTWYQYSQLGPANIAAAPALGSPAVYPAGYTLSCGLANTGTGSFGDCIRVRYSLTGAGATANIAVKAIGKPS